MRCMAYQQLSWPEQADPPARPYLKSDLQGSGMPAPLRLQQLQKQQNKSALKSLSNPPTNPVTTPNEQL